MHSNYHLQCGKLRHFFSSHLAFQSHLSFVQTLNLLHFCFAIYRFPFEVKNPIGYSIAFGIEYAMFSYAMKIGASVIAFAFGSFIYAIADSKYIKKNLIAISQSCHAKTEQKRIWEQLIEFIEFHACIIQLNI